MNEKLNDIRGKGEVGWDMKNVNIMKYAKWENPP